MQHLAWKCSSAIFSNFFSAVVTALFCCLFLSLPLRLRELFNSSLHNNGTVKKKKKRQTCMPQNNRPFKARVATTNYIYISRSSAFSGCVNASNKMCVGRLVVSFEFVFGSANSETSSPKCKQGGRNANVVIRGVIGKRHGWRNQRLIEEVSVPCFDVGHGERC